LNTFRDKKSRTTEKETCRRLSIYASYMQTLSTLCAFFWVIPRRLNFICRRFGALFLFHLHRPMKMEQIVPKRRHIKFRRRGIIQKKAYRIQNRAKVWNQENA